MYGKDENMEIVEFSEPEIKERLWLLDVILITRKIIEDGLCRCLTKEDEKKLLKRIELEVDKIIKEYKFIRDHLVYDRALIGDTVDYVYKDVELLNQLDVKQVYPYIEQIKNSQGYEKIGVAYYSDEVILAEDYWCVDHIIDKFYDENESEYKILNGDEKVAAKEEYYFRKRYYEYSIKDEYILNYLKVFGKDEQERLKVKAFVESMISLMDLGSVVLGWKVNSEEIKVIVEIDEERSDIFDFDMEFQYVTETVISLIVKKYVLIDKCDRMGESLYERN